MSVEYYSVSPLCVQMLECLSIHYSVPEIQSNLFTNIAEVPHAVLFAQHLPNEHKWYWYSSRQEYLAASHLVIVSSKEFPPRIISHDDLTAIWSTSTQFKFDTDQGSWVNQNVLCYP